jgi:hypothetical protein
MPNEAQTKIRNLYIILRHSILLNFDAWASHSALKRLQKLAPAEEMDSFPVMCVISGLWYEKSLYEYERVWQKLWHSNRP